MRVATSGLEVSGRDLACLILALLLLFYSCLSCYKQWKKNYQLPPGDFVDFRGINYQLRAREERLALSVCLVVFVLVNFLCHFWTRWTIQILRLPSDWKVILQKWSLREVMERPQRRQV